MRFWILAVTYIPVKTATQHLQCSHHLMLAVGETEMVSSVY
jgi:hypothetical protein